MFKKITSYVTSDNKVTPPKPAAPKKDDDDDSLFIEEILPADDESVSGLIVDVGGYANNNKCSLNDSYLLSQFLSKDGYKHITLLFNLHSGIELKTVQTEVTHGGMSLNISHALCPTFHDIETFEALVRKDPDMEHDKDEGLHFSSLHEVARLIKGDSTYIWGEKTIDLPFRCQETAILQHAMSTDSNELFIFLELQSVEHVVKDSQVLYSDSVIKVGSTKKARMTSSINDWQAADDLVFGAACMIMLHNIKPYAASTTLYTSLHHHVQYVDEIPVPDTARTSAAFIALCISKYYQ